MRVGLRSRIYLALVAFAGTLAAHSIAYRFAAPEPHHHATLLLETGHGYWSFVTPLAVGLMVAGIAGALLGGARSQQRFGGIAGRAVILQVVAFLIMETVERASVGGSLSVLQEPVVLIGLVVQVLVALALAGLLVVLTRALDTSTGSSVPLHRPSVPKSFVETVNERSLLRGFEYGGALLRAPPVTANI
jgi:hypothetical protein